MSHAYYLAKVFTRGQFLNDWRQYSAQLPNFDFLVGTGVSGALPLAMLQEEFGHKIAIVRKPSDKWQMGGIEASANVDTYARPPAWIMIDDCICSGGTLRHVWERICMRYPRSLFLGVYTYDTGPHFYTASNCTDWLPEAVRHNKGVQVSYPATAAQVCRSPGEALKDQYDGPPGLA